MHVPVAGRDATVAHHDGDLVQRLGQQGPEIPVVGGRTQIGAWVALDRLVEVRELARVAQEEYRRVVADHVPVAFLGIELQCESADVAFGIGRAALAGHGGEAGEHPGLLADRAEDLRSRVFRDVVGDGEGAEGAGALGMHAPLRYHLADEVGQLFVEPHVLRQQGTARAGGKAVLVVRHRRAELGGEVGDGTLLPAIGWLAHDRLLYCRPTRGRPGWPANVASDDENRQSNDVVVSIGVGYGNARAVSPRHVAVAGHPQ